MKLVIPYGLCAWPSSSAERAAGVVKLALQAHGSSPIAHQTRASPSLYAQIRHFYTASMAIAIHCTQMHLLRRKVASTSLFCTVYAPMGLLVACYCMASVVLILHVSRTWA